MQQPQAAAYVRGTRYDVARGDLENGDKRAKKQRSSARSFVEHRAYSLIIKLRFQEERIVPLEGVYADVARVYPGFEQSTVKLRDNARRKAAVRVN